MSKILNLKVLLIVFGALAVIVVVLLLTEGSKPERTFKSELFTVDTAKITSIIITPKLKEKGDIVLTKSGNQSKLTLNKKQVSADKDMIAGILTQLTTIKPERVAARDESKWVEYEVTDSAATRVQIKQAEEKTADFLIGKFSAKQNQSQNYCYQQPQYSMTSYIRLTNEPEVYAVDGFLSMTFNRSLDDFRNKTIIKSETDNWTTLKFNYPGDSSFVVSKQNDKWMLEGILTDSAQTVKYLNSIAYLSSSDFVDKPANELYEPLYSLVIEGNNFNPFEIKAFAADTIHGFFIHSSLNPEAVFSSANDEIIEKLFVGKNKFQKPTQE